MTYRTRRSGAIGSDGEMAADCGQVRGGQDYSCSWVSFTYNIHCIGALTIKSVGVCVLFIK